MVEVKGVQVGGSFVLPGCVGVPFLHSTDSTCPNGLIKNRVWQDILTVCFPSSSAGLLFLVHVLTA